MDFLKFLGRLFPNQTDNPDKELADQFFQLLGYRFNNSSLLTEALTHRSYVRSNGSEIPSNERLEYLGDSVLGLLVADYLYKTYPKYAEGDLTKTKAMLVNENTLSMSGRSCGLNKLILLSPDEEKSGGRERSSIVSDALEATIGAIYLDGGLNEAQSFIMRTVISHIGDVLADADQYNYKGDLLELMQGKGEKIPYYEVISETGPDHSKIFEVAVHAGAEVTATGTGASKKEAEQKAAAEALAMLKALEKKND